MYKGEVIIESKRLENLQRTAKELNISGFIFIEEMDYPHAEETNEKANQAPPISKLGLYPPGEGRTSLCLKCNRLQHFKEEH